MDMKNTYTDCGSRIREEDFTVRLTNPMLYDRLHTLSAEYALSAELLVNIAVKRMIDDVDFVRNLRFGKTEIE